MRKRRGTAAILLGVVLSAAAMIPVAPAQLLNLDEVFCELDPAYDYCISRQLKLLMASMDPGPARDKVAVYAFAGIYLSHRREEQNRLNPPDVAYYDQFTDSNQIDYVIYILDLMLNHYFGADEEDIAEANLRLGEMQPGLPRLLAYRYVADAQLRFGDEALAVTYIAALAEEIESIESLSARIPYLADLGWLQARAGLTEDAVATSEAIVAIAATHPIAQLRPIFAVEAAAAEGIAIGVEAGTARLAAAEAALPELPGSPPGFGAITTAIFAKNYGRMGLLDEARALVEQALGMIGDVEPGQEGDFLRMLMEAGVN